MVTDTIHTNKQRIEKIYGLIQLIEMIHQDPILFQYNLDSLYQLAQEARGSVDGINEFLSIRNALQQKE